MSKSLCKVCGRSFKLVGKNPQVLATHGFTKDIYGNSEPCWGSGYVPENSLSLAINRAEHLVEYWERNNEPQRVNYFKSIENALQEKKAKEIKSAQEELVPQLEEAQQDSVEVVDYANQLNGFAVELEERLNTLNKKIKYLSEVQYVADWDEAHIINEIHDRTYGEYLYIPENN